MSLKFGLNIKKTAPTRKPIFDEPSDDDDPQQAIDDTPRRPPPKRSGLTKPSAKSTAPPPPPPPLRKLKADDAEEVSHTAASRKRVKAAEEVDPSIFDYDTFLDAKSTVHEAKKAAARQEAVERNPKYIDKLLDAASRRKQDQLVAKEKLLQRERETEGDEFADKEKFVTGAYKQQQEETRRLQEEEQKKAEADEERRRRMGGGMQSFYRSMIDQTEKNHQEAVEAAANYEKQSGSNSKDEIRARSDAEIAADMRAKGVSVQLNEEGQLVDKRELLSAGLNVAPSGKGKDSASADHLRTSAQRQSSAFPRRDRASDRAQGERQRQMIEEQMETSAKRKREEEEEQRAEEEREAKSKKTDKDVNDAKARYLARKAARERGEG